MKSSSFKLVFAVTLAAAAAEASIGYYGGYGLGYGGYGLGYGGYGYGGHLWKRDAEAEPQYGYRGGYRGGYGGGYRGYGGRGYYGKRSAEAEPESDPSIGYGYGGKHISLISVTLRYRQSKSKFHFLAQFNLKQQSCNYFYPN